MHPSEALDEQAALLDHILSADYVEYMQGFLRSYLGKAYGEEFEDPKLLHEAAYDWTKSEALGLRMSSTYHVDSEIMPLLKWAADNLDETDSFRRNMWPAEHGFLIFDTSWYFTDIWGDLLGLKAISWKPAHEERSNRNGMLLSVYADLNDPHDTASVRLRDAGDRAKLGLKMGHLQIMHMELIQDGAGVGPPILPVPENYVTYQNEMSPDARLAQEAPNTQRMLLALIMLMGQTVTDNSEAQIPRVVARRARRAQIPGRVTVIRLRRSEDSVRRVGETAVEWSHRWLVKGSWQWRHCSQEHPLAEEYEKGWHARVWVHGHLKGPQDKPLVITDKVSTLTR